MIEWIHDKFDDISWQRQLSEWQVRDAALIKSAWEVATPLLAANGYELMHAFLASADGWNIGTRRNDEHFILVSLIEIDASKSEQYTPEALLKRIQDSYVWHDANSIALP